MNTKLRLALLRSAALILISPLFAHAGPGDPIPGTEVGLEGDPEGTIVATTPTDAAGKFEFKGLKAGKYRLVVLPSGSTTTLPKVGGNSEFGKQTVVADGAQLQLQRTFTITFTPGTPDSKITTLSVDLQTGRSLHAIVIPMDNGIISGALKIADNESPRPQDRKLTGSGTTIVGKFVSFKDGKLTLLVSAGEGEEPQLTEFGRVTAVVVDPTDPMAKTLPAEEAFKDLKVGAPVKLETNTRGQTAVFILRAETNNVLPAGTKVRGDAVVAPVDPNAWRYKEQNGEWWYYGPDEKWLVHRNGKWIPYQAAGGTVGRQGTASIFDRWGNRLPTGKDQGANGNAATPGTAAPGLSSPLGRIIPGRQQQPAGANVGSAVRGAFGGKR